MDILTDISESRFVAIDLELSGVCSKTVRTESGRQTLQQRYLETKEAAERYQILQIGLTCVHQDVETQKYILKPYNFNLCPIVQERGLSNDIERIFSYQSGAVEFLLKVGFDMAKPFTHGVPYLSRAEARSAREKYGKRQDKNAISDIHIKATDIESLAFMQRIRTEVDAFLDANHSDHYNIDSIGPTHKGEDPPDDLSRFEKRLVHQLVRAEYPQLVTISKRGFVQVVKFNKQREDKVALDRKHDFEQRVNRQKGFRWVIDALLGSASVANLDVRECARNPVTGESIYADMDQYRAQFHRAFTRIRGNPKVIIGHNCFLDMVYIYRTFIGPLPDTVEEFSKTLHQHWPTVVDTKYMSTHNCGDINPVSSLEQIAQQLSDQKLPNIEVDKFHRKYDDVEAFHEAGYDSFLTAQVAVRLSAKLERAGNYSADPLLVSSTGPSSAKDELVTTLSTLKVASPSISNALSFTTNTSDTSETNNVAHESKTSTEPTGFTPSDPNIRWKRHGDPSVGPLLAPTDLKHHYKFDPDAAGIIVDGMPRINSDFWRVYGNKLRVFGTEEAVCVLSEEGSTPVSGDEDGDGGVAVL